MAGDWIKMRTSLRTDPKIVRISSALKADILKTLGGVLSAWCLFDEHSEDGRLEGYTPEVLDSMVGFPGLARAMISVGWLEDADNCLIAVNFSEHNGKSAKRRAQDSVRKKSAREADEMRTREEKSIKEKINKKESSNKTALPENFTVSERVYKWAAENGHSNPDLHLENFKLQVKAHNYRYVDWDAAFMTAIRKNWAGIEQQRRPGRAHV